MDKLDLILEQLQEINSIFSAVRNRVDETDAKMDSVSMDLHKVLGYVTALQDGQERHERLLERLALRSIEQETLLENYQKYKP
ncbi:hypothetical protein PA598K_04723 [Paenibacillus sp. 598K]|uniref:hypothetical protein n=1 Tax=Paenibacillus sp. 598K TaxID=1117987 RepID=UPI000FF92C17|nr:hypothetical protein [Paenibacillus sp. 598K]GBF76268.1 hypothetical protein PA598K_04723 [Paenibacillus sp. 598K]